MSFPSEDPIKCGVLQNHLLLTFLQNFYFKKIGWKIVRNVSQKTLTKSQIGEMCCYILGICFLKKWTPELIFIVWVYKIQFSTFGREVVIYHNVDPLAIVPKPEVKYSAMMFWMVIFVILFMVVWNNLDCKRTDLWFLYKMEWILPYNTCSYNFALQYMFLQFFDYSVAK